MGEYPGGFPERQFEVLERIERLLKEQNALLKEVVVLLGASVPTYQKPVAVSFSASVQ